MWLSSRAEMCSSQPWHMQAMLAAGCSTVRHHSAPNNLYIHMLLGWGPPQAAALTVSCKLLHFTLPRSVQRQKTYLAVPWLQHAYLYLDL